MSNSRHTVEMPITAKDMTRAAFDSAKKRMQSLNGQMTVMNTQARAANSSFRGMRGSMGQLGYQIQDVAVQLQNGTNGFIVFGQQGSQIASLMGPGGAVLGAIVAVGAALGASLAPKLFESTDAAKNLERALEAVAAIAVLTDKRTLQLSDSMARLAESSRDAVAVQLQAAAIQAEAALTAAVAGLGERLDEEIGGVLGPSITEALSEAQEAIGEGISLDRIMARAGNPGEARRLARQFGPLRGAIRELGTEFGITEEAALALLGTLSTTQENPTEENLNALLDTVVALEPASGTASNALRLIQSDLIDTQQEAERAREILNKLNEAVANNQATGVLPETKEQADAREEADEQYVDSLTRRMTAEIEHTQKLIEESQKRQLTYDEEAKAKQQAAMTIVSLTSMQMSQMSRSFEEGNAAGRAFFAVQQGIAAANAIISGHVAGMAIQESWAKMAALTVQPWLNTVGTAHMMATIGMGYATAATIAAQTVASFDGGGYTGNGPRSGGLDGKGGFLAMMHPRETVTDHTKGGGMGGDINVHLGVSPIDAKGFDQMLSSRQGLIVRMVDTALRARGVSLIKGR